MSNQNCTPCQNVEQERSLMNIGIASFVVVELTEYLDTHPHDREALNYFNYYNRMLNKMGHGASSMGRGVKHRCGIMKKDFSFL